jgi:transposase-like protein
VVGTAAVVPHIIYRGSPPNDHLHPTHTLSKIQSPYSKMDNISYNDRIKLAITDLESQAQSNFSSTARIYDINRITLARRFKNESISKQNTISYISKALTNAEEDVLVRYINDLNARGLPPTPQIMKNLTEEIANTNLRPNWTTRFLQRKKNVLRSVYLTTIDHKRKISDNSHHYEYFYINVRLRFSLLRVIFNIEVHFYLIAKPNRQILYSITKSMEFR